jgi:hypothetical protein
MKHPDIYTYIYPYININSISEGLAEPPDETIKNIL